MLKTNHYVRLSLIIDIKCNNGIDCEKASVRHSLSLYFSLSSLSPLLPLHTSCRPHPLQTIPDSFGILPFVIQLYQSYTIFPAINRKYMPRIIFGDGDGILRPSMIYFFDLVQFQLLCNSHFHPS